MFPCRRRRLAGLLLAVVILGVLSCLDARPLHRQPAAAPVGRAPQDDALARAAPCTGRKTMTSPRGRAAEQLSAVGRFSWNPIVVTYALSPTATVDYPPRDAVRGAFQRAFARWARVIPVSFAEARRYDAADIKIGFYGGDHFDGPCGVLANAELGGHFIHLDAAERWAVDLADAGSDRAIHLESVATHEIGHVLGLDHLPSPDAVMYAYLSPMEVKLDLTVDDVQAVQRIYGANPHFKLSDLDHKPAPAEPSSRSSPPKSSWIHAGSARLLASVLLILVAHL